MFSLQVQSYRAAHICANLFILYYARPTNVLSVHETLIKQLQSSATKRRNKSFIDGALHMLLKS